MTPDQAFAEVVSQIPDLAAILREAPQEVRGLLKVVFNLGYVSGDRDATIRISQALSKGGVLGPRSECKVS